jgi:hypothetical protein
MGDDERDVLLTEGGPVDIGDIEGSRAGEGWNFTM